MSIRFVTASIFLIAALSSNAHALSIAGWGFKIGSIEADLVLKGVPNPATKPTLIKLDLTLTDIEALCLNPQNKNVSPGSAGTRSVTVSEYITPNDISSPLSENGKVFKTVPYNLLIDASEIACNNLWIPIPSSAAAKAFAATVTFQYEDTTKGQDVIKASCVLNPVKRFDENGFDLDSGTYGEPYAPVRGQLYVCTQTSP